jgi:6-methylsalicylate decarboxylase
LKVDVHQHLWPEALIALLARRSEPPRVRRRGDGWYIETPGEPETAFDPAGHDPELRAELVRADGLDLACVALSSPLGIESLPPSAAQPLLDAWHESAATFPPELRAWAAPMLAAPDPGELGELLDRGFVGICLPAEALARPDAVERWAPVLELLGDREKPLFVHPGPAPETLPRPASTGAAPDTAAAVPSTNGAAPDTAAAVPSTNGAAPDTAAAMPLWWPALTRYVAAMSTAWHAFAAAGPVHPRLRVCFAMLAGLAPLHRERLLRRGGDAAAMPELFLDTSSYGPRAIDAVIRELGVDALVYGSDRPVVAPAAPDFGEAVRVAMLSRNPARMLGLAGVPA